MKVTPMYRCVAPVLLAGACLTMPVFAQTAARSAIPAHQKAIALFDGTDLSKFDTFLRGRGLNADPDKVFRVEQGVIHVSGKEMGYLLTKRSFHRFYLRADFKWGEGTFAERAGQARDSGILFNIQGEQKVWPRSIEFQIKEGETGDFWMTDGAALTGADGRRVTGPPGSALNIGHIGKGPTQNTVGFRNSSGEMEKPRGEWNTLELVVEDKVIHQYVNGKLAAVGTDPFPTEGKVLFQSEGAEVFFRDIQIAPLK
ncbi:MAG: DUF1080 domain-containing protein [Acidobacteriaceae bacterium]